MILNGMGPLFAGVISWDDFQQKVRETGQSLYRNIREIDTETQDAIYVIGLVALNIWNSASVIFSSDEEQELPEIDRNAETIEGQEFPDTERNEETMQEPLGERAVSRSQLGKPIPFFDFI